MDLFGKVIIITGASRGIGAATAQAFAPHGCNIVLSARTESELHEVARRAGKKSTLVVPGDITKKDDVQTLIQTTLEHFDRIDILINNAGTGLVSAIHEMNPDDLDAILSINLFGPIYCMQNVIPVMKSQSGGIIMNVSSMITRMATPGSGGYRASKCALNAITEAARIELRNYNIRVISIFPGLTATRFFAHCLGIAEKPVMYGNSQLHGRTPEFVANKIVQSARKETTAVYMTPVAAILGSLAQMFPNLAEKAINFKKMMKH